MNAKRRASHAEQTGRMCDLQGARGWPGSFGAPKAHTRKMQEYLIIAPQGAASHQGTEVAIMRVSPIRD